MDIVERLTRFLQMYPSGCPVVSEAAAEILKLRAELADRQRTAESWKLRHDRKCEALAEVATERDELRAAFNLRWEADMRAIKRWQEATGRDQTWPDHADMVVWLLNERDALLVGDARYEYLRRLTPRQFAELHERNIKGEGRFDELVDGAISAAEGEAVRESKGHVAGAKVAK
jgi:hypothetical protein